MPTKRLGVEKAKKGGFMKAWNKIIRDKRLSHQELGMLIRLMALPDTWDFNYDGFVKLYPESRKTSVMNTIGHLKEKGYVKIEKSKNSRGQYQKNTLILIYDAYGNSAEGKSNAENPNTENPNTENPNTENPMYVYPHKENNI
ncbi:MAG: hypothetical protein ACLTKI_01000 [Lachnospiraceae bacterium]